MLDQQAGQVSSVRQASHTRFENFLYPVQRHLIENGLTRHGFFFHGTIEITYNRQLNRSITEDYGVYLDQRDAPDITRLLQSWSGGNQAAVDDLMPLVYDELHKVAAQYLRKQRPDHTLQPTALVNEAYLKLVDISSVSWQDRAHFFAVASQTMRHVLVDHARGRNREKRGGGAQKVSLDEAVAFAGSNEIDVLALDDAMRALAEIDDQQSKIVELRFFGGLTVEETAIVLRISPATVKREWRIAKAWLHKRITD